MLALDDFLYGMTEAGGRKNIGVIFRIALDGSGYEVLHDFTGDEGAIPHSGVVFDGTYLWGMTERGGSHQRGILFRITPSGSDFEVIHSFDGSHGEEPHGTPHLFGDTLYGMTRKGGDNGLGVVFSYGAGSYSVLHSFTGAAHDGATPFHGNLIEIGSYLYGLTHDGGADDSGVVFRLKPGSEPDVLRSFKGKPDGGHPLGTLTALSNTDWLYGTTDDGGVWGLGSLFGIRADGGGYKQLSSCTPKSGTNPPDNLTFCNGYLYGLTQFGPGTSKLGTIFRIMPIL